MSDLTTEQLQQLTERVNERLSEFDAGDCTAMQPLTLGVVRVVVDVYEEWREVVDVYAGGERTRDC